MPRYSPTGRCAACTRLRSPVRPRSPDPRQMPVRFRRTAATAICREESPRWIAAIRLRRSRLAGHDRAMPRFRVTGTVTTRDASAVRVVCDGCDPARPCDEHTERSVLWLLTAGAFELRDATGRHALDPTQAIAMPPRHVFQ